jgi:hypothetical protein
MSRGALHTAKKSGRNEEKSRVTLGQNEALPNVKSGYGATPYTLAPCR